eukprot:16427104-Heterocapsa_arctica.AAC.1
MWRRPGCGWLRLPGGGQLRRSAWPLRQFLRLRRLRLQGGARWRLRDTLLPAVGRGCWRWPSGAAR